MTNGDESTPDSGSEDDIEERLRPELDEALLALDELCCEDAEEALSMLDTLPKPVQALPEFQLLAARAHQYAGSPEAAYDLLLALAATGFESSDLHHQMGDVLEDLGHLDKANEHFLLTRAEDEKAWAQLSTADREAEQQAVLGLLHRLMQATDRIDDVTVEILPTKERVLSGVDPRSLCHWDESTRSLVGYAANFFAEYGSSVEDEDVYDLAWASLLDHLKDALAFTDARLDDLTVKESPPAD